MDFKQKVQSMTAKEIIMAMVDGLTIPPIMKINMSSYGHTQVDRVRGFFGLFKRKLKTCFGCAATVTVCKIAQIEPLELLKDGGSSAHSTRLETRAENLNTDYLFLHAFEQAINSLRSGYIPGYNAFAVCQKFAIISNPGYLLPALSNNYTNEDLEAYKRLAEAQ